MKRCLHLLMSICLLTPACANKQKKPPTDPLTDEPPPKLLAPSVRKIWIPGQMKDGGQEWEAGHYLFRIERNTSWSR
jgi:hypothetical protein